MVHADLAAERAAVESYDEMIAFVGEGDSTTRMLEGIPATRAEHADDLVDLLSDIDGA